MKEDPVDKSWWLVTRNELFLIHYFPASTKSQVYDFSKANKNIHGSMPGPVYDMLFLNGRPVLATHNGAWQVEKKQP